VVFAARGVKSLNRKVALALVLSTALACCGPSVQHSLEARDIRLCGGAELVTASVRRLSANHGLSFHYGTHQADFGTQATFRLIGDGFEIVLFNVLDETDYTLRVYDTPPGRGAQARARNTYRRLAAALISDRSVECSTTAGAPALTPTPASSRNPG
jgi:hypothetical protein